MMQFSALSNNNQNYNNFNISTGGNKRDDFFIKNDNNLSGERGKDASSLNYLRPADDDNGKDRSFPATQIRTSDPVSGTELTRLLTTPPFVLSSTVIALPHSVTVTASTVLEFCGEVLIVAGDRMVSCVMPPSPLPKISREPSSISPFDGLKNSRKRQRNEQNGEENGDRRDNDGEEADEDHNLWGREGKGDSYHHQSPLAPLSSPLFSGNYANYNSGYSCCEDFVNNTSDVITATIPVPSSVVCSMAVQRLSYARDSALGVIGLSNATIVPFICTSSLHHTFAQNGEKNDIEGDFPSENNRKSILTNNENNKISLPQIFLLPPVPLSYDTLNSVTASDPVISIAIQCFDLGFDFASATNTNLHDKYGRNVDGNSSSTMPGTPELIACATPNAVVLYSCTINGSKVVNGNVGYSHPLRYCTVGDFSNGISSSGGLNNLVFTYEGMQFYRESNICQIRAVSSLSNSTWPFTTPYDNLNSTNNIIAGIDNVMINREKALRESIRALASIVIVVFLVNNRIRFIGTEIPSDNGEDPSSLTPLYYTPSTTGLRSTLSTSVNNDNYIINCNSDIGGDDDNRSNNSINSIGRGTSYEKGYGDANRSSSSSSSISSNNSSSSSSSNIINAYRSYVRTFTGKGVNTRNNPSNLLPLSPASASKARKYDKQYINVSSRDGTGKEESLTASDGNINDNKFISVKRPIFLNNKFPFSGGLFGIIPKRYYVSLEESLTLLNVKGFYRSGVGTQVSNLTANNTTVVDAEVFCHLERNGTSISLGVISAGTLYSDLSTFPGQKSINNPHSTPTFGKLGFINVTRNCLYPAIHLGLHPISGDVTSDGIGIGPTNAVNNNNLWGEDTVTAVSVLQPRAQNELSLGGFTILPSRKPVNDKESSGMGISIIKVIHTSPAVSSVHRPNPTRDLGANNNSDDRNVSTISALVAADNELYLTTIFLNNNFNNDNLMKMAGFVPSPSSFLHLCTFNSSIQDMIILPNNLNEVPYCPQGTINNGVNNFISGKGDREVCLSSGECCCHTINVAVATGKTVKIFNFRV